MTRVTIAYCMVTLLVACRASAEDGLALKDDRNTPEQLRFFENKIRPVLVKHCYRCHSAKEAKADLTLDTREGIRHGGESGPAVVPGALEKSIILEALAYEGLEMPPKGQLSEEVIADFTSWIKMGAPDPRDSKAPVKTSPRDDGSTPHWAFQPVTDPQIPAVRNKAWAQSPVPEVPKSTSAPSMT